MFHPMQRNNIIQPLAEITQDELDEYLPSMIEQWYS